LSAVAAIAREFLSAKTFFPLSPIPHKEFADENKNIRPQTLIF
jgi:hypothetical protein